MPAGEDSHSSQAACRRHVAQTLADAARCIAATVDRTCDELTSAAEDCAVSLQRGGKLLFCGNGGSAAQAQHLAAELVNRLSSRYERRPLAAIALTADQCVLTAAANDYHFDVVFERQMEALARQGDVLVAFSTSGNSRNVLHAIHAARRMRIASVGFTGPTGDMLDLVTHKLSIGSDNPQRIQEAHAVLGHILVELIERIMLKE